MQRDVRGKQLAIRTALKEHEAVVEHTEKMATMTSRRLFRYCVFTLTILLFAAAIVSAQEARDTDVGDLSVPEIEEALQVRATN